MTPAADRGTPAARAATTAGPGPRTVPLASGDGPDLAAVPGRRGRPAVSIVQIGDSHTAADLFTGTARQILQERFGAGGVGYLAAGRPHPGVRSTGLAPSASTGWTYDGIQRSAQPDAFGLSGYTARTAREGETLSFGRETPVPYGSIEIEARTGPGAGSVAVEIDGVPVLSASLAADDAAPRILEVRPPSGHAAFRQMTIRTLEAKPVAISAVGIFRRGSGLTYSAVGVPGATVDLLGRYPERTLADGLRRLAPDIVVLAFGTNEGFDANLDPAAYEARYTAAIRAIRRAVPKARLVMIGPPQAERAAPACRPAEGRACPAPGAAAEPRAGSGRPDACPGRPPQLDGVRAVQRRLAEAERIPFFDWWAIMPAGCGASRWADADPPLMAKDRVHFTRAGYRVGGQAFARFLEPEVRALLRGDDAVSHH
ncbi:lipolytic protein G-D-S-L family [Methylobacterium variabile]|uniref:Lipolytic protein G-D-S-L family n=1 Tax=Methylobacterium variabile TaxID=298794 RepID=A0A0J6SGN7_9HYPH|nr:lipolytic protein G-D-S-L family [Methylobacterium variabile]